MTALHAQACNMHIACVQSMCSASSAGYLDYKVAKLKIYQTQHLCMFQTAVLHVRPAISATADAGTIVHSKCVGHLGSALRNVTLLVNTCTSA